jgi:hypothetical protein
MTIELLDDQPMVMTDVNDKDQIIGIEYIGVKQFGFNEFMRLLQERLRRVGIELTTQEAESFISFMRTPKAETALSS